MIEPAGVDPAAEHTDPAAQVWTWTQPVALRWLLIGSFTEFGYDYLRDNLARERPGGRPERPRVRGCPAGRQGAARRRPGSLHHQWAGAGRALVGSGAADRLGAEV